MKSFTLKFALTFLLGVGLASAAVAQKIGGTVKDSAGKPVVGASVIVEGSTLGASSGVDGQWSLNVPDASKKTLVISYIGMKTQRIAIGSKTQIDVTLEDESTAMDDVVVVGYATVKRRDVVGSVASVNAETLQQMPVASVAEAMTGRMAGVQITATEGDPDAEIRIRVRGAGTFSSDGAPLYIVDGFPVESISDISSSEIQSIDILKDAFSTAIYGSRGANGVVLINTKKGNRNETNVELKINVGVSSRAIPRYETVGARDFMEIMYSAFYNDYGSNAVAQMASGSKRIFGSNEMYNPYDVPLAQLFTADGKVRDDAKLLWDEDWLDEVTDNAALRQEYGASVSGGNEKTQYMFSLGYLNEDGVLKTTNFERYSGRLNVETQAKPWFAAGMGANFARNSTNSSQTSASATSNVFFSAQMMAPIYPVYQRDPETGDYLRDANGRKQFDYGSSRPSGQQTNFNSIATLYDDKYAQTSYSLSARAHMDFMGISDHWSEGLKFQLNFGTDYYNSQSMTYYNPFFGNAESVGGRIQKTNTTSLGYTFNQLLSYNRTFDRHNIDLLLGHEYYAYTTSDLSGHKTGLPGGGIYELDAAAVIVGTGSSTDEDRIESVFSRIGYSYDDKYYLSGSWRTDGSSRFARSTRWGNFWSVGASWRMSQEAFMRDISWLNNLTLKFSYGVQGNNSVGSYYAYQALYDTGSPNATLPGATINDVANEDLTWESNHNLNVGLEARLLDRIDLSFEFYNRKTTDMLLSYPLASSSGFDSYYRNSGEMRNRGIEFAVTGRIFDRRDFQWSVTWMGSTVSNKVLKLAEDGKDIIGSTQIIREGETLYSYYVARSAGVDPMTGEKMYWATDKDGNDYITKSTTVAQANRVIAGSRIPDLYGSLSTSLRWKNLDFSISTNYSIGGKNYDGVYYEFMSCYYTAQAKHKDMLRAWRKPGDVTDVPKYTIGETPIVTDDKLVDASYFSIKNITLGYTLPRRWTSKIGFKAARVSASVDNLCIFTHLKGMDPQYSLTGGTSYAYAPTRTVSFNLDLKF